MIILSESDVTRGLSHTSRHLDPEGTGTRVLWGRWEGVQVGIDPPAAWHGLCPWGHWSAGSASCPRPHRSYLRSVRSLQAASEATLVVAPDRPLRQPDPCAFPATHAVHGFCCWSHRRSEWAPWGLRGGTKEFPTLTFFFSCSVRPKKKKRYFIISNELRFSKWDFSGSPLVKTLPSKCRARRFCPCICSYMPCGPKAKT